MNIGRRQAKGIAGMALAVLGGVAWFYQLNVAAFVLWGGAVVIMLSLNRRRRRA
jgi:Flp pilus assembly protein TadB